MEATIRRIFEQNELKILESFTVFGGNKNNLIYTKKAFQIAPKGFLSK